MDVPVSTVSNNVDVGLLGFVLFCFHFIQWYFYFLSYTSLTHILFITMLLNFQVFVQFLSYCFLFLALLYCSPRT